MVWGRGDRTAVDRVLSFIVDLRRISPLSFIPLVPYPARSARNLPHAGKALSVVILFLHVSYIRFDDMGKAASSYRKPSPLGKGDRAAVDRVLSFIVDLRRSPSLSFIPLEPYPARSARHLPHAGKALSVIILFLHVSCIRLDDARKAASSYRKPSPLGKGDRAAVDRVLSFIVDLRRSFPLFFIPLEPYPARSARHLPHAGKALSVVIVFPTYPVFTLTIWG